MEYRVNHAITFVPFVSSSLKAARHALHLTQPEMAESLGMGMRQYCKYELGTHIPTLRTRMALRYLLITANLDNHAVIQRMLETALNPTEKET